MHDLNELDGTAEPQSCYKCNALPEDILMLACGHDLCLNCAAQRLSIESKRKPANGIACQFCSEKTQLDVDSIYELEKIIKNTQELKPKRDVRQSNLRIHRPTEEQDVRKTDKLAKYQRSSRNEKRDYLNPAYDSKSVVGASSELAPVSYKQTHSSVSSTAKRNCPQHPDEEILYYCFECNCQCICPECVIHGKHRNHDVKTIKKSQPIVKSKLEYFLQNIDTNIDVLISKKNEFDGHIKQLVDTNNSNKKQIQRVFAELRNKLNTKEKEVVAKCNKALQATIDIYERGIKNTLKKIQDIKSSSHTIADHLKKQEMTMLNFYAKKHADFEQLVEKIDVNSLLDPVTHKLLNYEVITQAVTDIGNQIQKLDIDSSVRYDPKYDEKDRDSNRHTYECEQSEFSRAGRYAKEEDKPLREYARRY